MTAPVSLISATVLPSSIASNALSSPWTQTTGRALEESRAPPEAVNGAGGCNGRTAATSNAKDITNTAGARRRGGARTAENAAPYPIARTAQRRRICRGYDCALSRRSQARAVRVAVSRRTDDDPPGEELVTGIPTGKSNCRRSHGQPGRALWLGLRGVRFENPPAGEPSPSSPRNISLPLGRTQLPDVEPTCARDRVGGLALPAIRADEEAPTIE
jgi:hypothetical protein